MIPNMSLWAIYFPETMVLAIFSVLVWFRFCRYLYLSDQTSFAQDRLQNSQELLIPGWWVGGRFKFEIKDQLKLEQIIDSRMVGGWLGYV